MIKRPSLFVLMFCASALCLNVVTDRAALADENITSTIKVTPQKKLTDSEYRALSEAAGRILTHVHGARQDLRNNDLEAAKQDVNKGLTLVKIIENAAPTFDVDATIKSGDTTYTDKRTVKKLIVPVYSEMDESESVLFPIKQAKKEAAAQAAAKGSSTPMDIDFVFTRASLDVRGAKADLQKALEALDNKDAAAANQSLADIQNRLVVFEYDEWDAPVVRARSDFWEAVRSVENKDWAGAKAYLKDAAESLKYLKDRGGKEVSDKVKTVTDQFSSINKKLDEKKDSAKNDILSLWDKLSKGF
ncbi:MAG: YfdX family protein [Desulfomonilaceae bacterium]